MAHAKGDLPEDPGLFTALPHLRCPGTNDPGPGSCCFNVPCIAGPCYPGAPSNPKYVIFICIYFRPQKKDC